MIKLIFFTGKSSSGKDTIVEHLLKTHPTLVKYVSYTTRPMRMGETDHLTYHFVTEDFINKQKAIDVKHYNVKLADGSDGIWSYAFLDDFKDDKTYVITGALSVYESFKKYFKDNKNVELKLVYLYIDDRERLERAIKRCTDGNYSEVCRRYLTDEEDFSKEKLNHAGVNALNKFKNLDLHSCLKDIEAYLGLGNDKVKINLYHSLNTFMN